MTEPVQNHPCDECGQLDDHPMVHVWGVWNKNDRTTVNDPSFHFDCLPDQFVSQLGNEPQHAVTLSAIEAAKKGVHGDKLRKHILSQESDNDIEPEADNG